MDVETTKNRLKTAAGYLARREEALALTNAFSGGHRVLLLEGPPGCGKTALAEAAAVAWNAPFFHHALHAWAGDDDLFAGVDVAAAVGGDVEHVRQAGVLTLVARESATKDLVVLCLDEVDKAPERVEALLLDWLQSGRVPDRPGFHHQTVMNHVLVVITTNGTRPLGDALLRRCRRVVLRPLDVDVAVELISCRASVPAGVARLAWKAMRAIGGEEISLQEGVECAREVWHVAETSQDVRLSLAGWAARDEEGRARATRTDVAALWGEITAARRRHGGKP